MDSIEIHKLDAAGQWQFLAIDSHSNYTDTAPLPAKGQSAVWTYRATYRMGHERVCQWGEQ